jgi:hypothetical protein
VGEGSGNSPNFEDSDRDEKWRDTDNLDDYDDKPRMDSRS